MFLYGTALRTETIDDHSGHNAQITGGTKMVNLKELLERKKAEKEVAAQAAIAAVEAQKTASVRVAAEVAEKISAAKTLVFEVLALGDPDEETLAVLEAQYAELHGLRLAVEQEMRARKFAAEQEARWAKVAAFEKRIASLPTDQLSYDLATELVEFGALEEITPERKDQVFAYNKTVREAGNATRQTFVRQAFEKGKKTSHFYLDKKRWLGDALNKHHRTLEQSRRMLAGRHDVKPTFSTGSGAHKPTMEIALNAAVNPPAPAETPAPVASDATPKPARKTRREQERKQREPRPETKERGGAGSDEAARAMRGELPEE